MVALTKDLAREMGLCVGTGHWAPVLSERGTADGVMMRLCGGSGRWQAVLFTKKVEKEDCGGGQCPSCTCDSVESFWAWLTGDCT